MNIKETVELSDQTKTPQSTSNTGRITFFNGLAFKRRYLHFVHEHTITRVLDGFPRHIRRKIIHSMRNRQTWITVENIIKMCLKL